MLKSNLVLARETFKVMRKPLIKSYDLYNPYIISVSINKNKDFGFCSLRSKYTNQTSSNIFNNNYNNNNNNNIIRFKRKFSSDRTAYIESDLGFGFTAYLLLFGNMTSGILLTTLDEDHKSFGNVFNGLSTGLCYGLLKAYFYTIVPSIFWFYAIIMHISENHNIETSFGYLHNHHIMLHFIPNSRNLTDCIIKNKFNESAKINNIIEVYKSFGCISKNKY
jgi:hypothetical protein